MIAPYRAQASDGSSVGADHQAARIRRDGFENKEEQRMKNAIKAIALIVAATALVGTASGLGAGAERSGGTAVAYNVKLGKNGGAGGDDCVTVTFGKPMPTPCAAPKRAFWTFDGYWDTVKTDEKGNPIGKQYYNAKMKSVRNWDKTSATTLWAKWTSNFALSKIMSDWASISYFAMAILMVMFVAGGVCVGGGTFTRWRYQTGPAASCETWLLFVPSL